MEIHQAYKERCRKLLKIGYNYIDLNNYENFNDLMSEEVFNLIIRDKINRCNKRYRTKEKFKELYILKTYLKKESNIVFGTITLNDELLSKKENTYIRKIHNWLKKHFLIAILNKDFGKKTGREHYHFLGLTTEKIEIKLDENGKPRKSEKGYIIYELKNKDFKEVAKAKQEQFEPTLCIVNLEKNDFDKTNNYLLKLNNHSNKFLAKNRVRVIKSPLMKLYELRKY